MQGRTERPDYPTALNECLNSMPIEQGALTRRPGSRHFGLTRGGNPGRVISFDFKQASAYTLEFTSGYVRFRAPRLQVTGAGVQIVAISGATPPEFTTGVAHGFSSTTQVIFPPIPAAFALSSILLNRQFAIIVTAANKFTIYDAVTGAPIDGSSLAGGAAFAFPIYEIATPYVGDQWSQLRAIQADIPLSNSTTPGAFLLHPRIKPYVLQVVTPPTDTSFATFSLAAAAFKDGPYFDPVPGGTLATPSAKIGIINLTLSFNAYDAARAYAVGDYVNNGGNNYRSLVDANLGSAPPSANWVAVGSDDAIGPHGFAGTDVGRMVRLFSEPPIWDTGNAYVAGDVVSLPLGGTTTYWRCATGHAAPSPTPGTNPVWVVATNAVVWTWGKITSLLTEIDRALAGSVNIGDMTNGGGLAAAFDGITSQASAASAERASVFITSPTTITAYVGKNYSGAAAQTVGQGIYYPSSDIGIITPDLPQPPFAISITVKLRAKATAPANSSDGTLLGTSGPMSDTSAPIAVVSSDLTTAWNYVWFEVVYDIIGATGATSSITIACAEAKFFNAPGSGAGNGVKVQILGDALLYTSPIRVWRLGLYSDTTGWPTCGTYHEGRIWLSGVIANRIDSSRSNEPLNFAPTNADGSVPPNAGISYIFNAPDVNPIFWMQPEGGGIVCGTQGGEWLVQATANNLPLSPTTIQAHRQTKYNCANIEPRRTNLTMAVVQTFKRELLEYFADVYSGKFSAHDLAFTAKHLVKSGIEEIAYQQELVPVIWARCADGSLIGATYGRSSLVSSQPPEYAGWHRHTLGTGRTVESICIGGNIDGTLDTLTMVTNDPATGVRHVEALTNVFTEADTLATAWLLDDAVQPMLPQHVGTPAVGAPLGGMTLNGLWHLNGKTVQVFAAGLDCGQGELGTAPVDFLVTSGSVFVPYGDGVSAGSGSGLFTEAFANAALAAGQVVVGMTYSSRGQIVRPNSPAESGARIGPAFGKLARTQKYAISVVNSAGLSIGTTFTKLDPILFKDDAGNALLPLQTFTGIYNTTLTDDYSRGSRLLCWESTRPLPAIIPAIGGQLHTQDE